MMNNGWSNPLSITSANRSWQNMHDVCDFLNERERQGKVSSDSLSRIKGRWVLSRSLMTLSHYIKAWGKALFKERFMYVLSGRHNTGCDSNLIHVLWNSANCSSQVLQPSVLSRGGNLLASHDSIRFRFRGQRFDSKSIIDSKPIFDSKPIIDYQF